LAEPLDAVTIEIEHATLSVNPALCRRALLHVFETEKVKVDQVTLVQSNHELVRELNREYLGHDFETDVLSFRYSENDSSIEGEIYVDLDTALERCDEFGASFEAEVLRYTIHGALHLTGLADDTAERKAAMHAVEDRHLVELGLM